MAINILTVFVSFALLAFASRLMIEGLSVIARYLKWREFVLAFFTMGIGVSLPNLFLGISSVIHKIPELAFGDMVGNNVVDLTLVAGIAALLGKGLATDSKMVQQSALLMLLIAMLPLLLASDGILSRADGIALLVAYFLSSFWLFSKRSLLTGHLEQGESLPGEFRKFVLAGVRVGAGFLILLLAAEGVVRSASFFADTFRIPIALMGVLGTGLGNSLPELYFSIAGARIHQYWLLLGNLMGSVMVGATLVIGIVAILQPIAIADFSPFVIARFFLVVAAIFFFFFVKTGKKVSSREALFLLALYLLFLGAEILKLQGK